MALEDFFTLTEMKDGLTAPARVKELISVLQKDDHNSVKNVGDSTRQWSAVASTIASTENKDCLALFLQLDGLCYFDTWLKNGQKCLEETGDSFIEESMVVLLGAIEKLHREENNSVISGIMMTVKDLLSNNSSRVQDRARALFDSWKQTNESNVVQMDVDKYETVCDDVVDVNGNPVSKHEQPECSSQDISTSRGISSEEKNLEPAMDEITPAISMQTEVVVGLTIQTSDKTLDHASIHDASPDPVHSSTLKLLSENSSVLGNPSKHQIEATTGIKSSGSTVPEPKALEGHLDVSNSNKHDAAKQMKQMLQIRSCNNLGSIGTFCADSANTMESRVGTDNEKDVDIEKGDPCLKENLSGEVRKEVSEGIDEMDDSTSPNPCSKISAFDSTALVDVLQGSYLNAHNEVKNEGVSSNLSRKEDAEAIEGSSGQNVSNEAEVIWGNVDLTSNLSRNEDAEAIELSNVQNVSVNDEVNRGSEDLTTNLLRKEDAAAIEEQNSQSASDEDEFVRRNDPEFSMSKADLNEKNSEIQHDYDMLDPLEVARQVAIEVQREVDCREPSCSSSERKSGSGIRLPESPESPDSMKGKKSRVMHRPCKDVSTGSNLSSVGGHKVFARAKNLHSEGENCIVDIEPTGVCEVAQKLEPDEDKHVGGFDLNEDLLSDDMDNQTNPVPAPISLCSASRAAATSGLPLSPLEFDGTLVLKGSAKTSAFCPAPTQKVSEGENFIFASGSSSLFRQQEYLDFDLNVAESEDNNISDLPQSLETPNSTARPSGGYSLESCLKRSDLLQLDLNTVNDSGDAPISYWRKEERVLPYGNGQFSPSASSSSSSIQPSLRNIDLNEQPSPFTENLHLTANSSANFCTVGFGGFKTNESVISLMGARVEVSQKDNIPQTIPLLNGRIVDPPLDAGMARNDSVLGLASSSLYAHSYMYGYNGPSSGSTVPYSSAIYGLGGQIPYMVDSRGTPVVPQVLGHVPAFSPSFPQPPSSFESLAVAPADSNGFVPSGHSFDLNSGLMFEGRGRDVGNTRQLFNPGQEILMDEQMRANSQSTSSSGVGGKRKETDGGWDHYPFNYKHHQPPWR